MKETSLENPNIIVKDERIETLDAIVNDVLESEEWEETNMSIYSVAWELGEKAGMESGIEIGEQKNKVILICKKLQKGKSLDVIADEMETDRDSIDAVFAVIQRFAPDYDMEKVLDAWLHKE